MPQLAPFPALRFTRAGGDLSSLLAPPYDVIDAIEAAELRARSEHNCVRLILPEGSEDERYINAAQTLEAWLKGGVLAVDPHPAVYVYRQRFEVDGGMLERLAVFAQLRLSPFGEGEVLPHERTHSGPKKDRLALTLATRTQLSPIFMVARDGNRRLYDLQSDVVAGAATVEGTTPDGIHHELWVVSDDRADALTAAAGAHPLLIADGHHRYETALVVADTLGDDVKAAHLLVCVVSQADPGLIVRPTHRTLSRPPFDARADFDWLSALEGAFDLTPLGDLTAAAGEARAASAMPGEFVVVPGDAGESWLASARREAVAGAGIPPERCRIAPVLFDEIVLGGLYGLEADEAAREGLLTYSRTPEAAAAPAGGCAFILPPVSLDDVWATAANGGRLPPKSTYFEPKMPSGLLFRPL